MYSCEKIPRLVTAGESCKTSLSLFNIVELVIPCEFILINEKCGRTTFYSRVDRTTYKQSVRKYKYNLITFKMYLPNVPQNVNIF